MIMSNIHIHVSQTQHAKFHTGYCLER